MMPSRLLLVLLCLYGVGLYASSNDTEPVNVPLDLSTVIDGSNNLTLPQQKSFFYALDRVKSEVVAATLILSNTFGRMALASFLAYRGYQSLIKIRRDAVKRSRHILKSFCYFGAMCMLICDGYQWVLRKEVDA